MQFGHRCDRSFCQHDESSDLVTFKYLVAEQESNEPVVDSVRDF